MAVRSSFKDCHRALVKLGSNVLVNEQGRLAIGRIGSVIEQIVRMIHQRKEVIVITSGAVAVGRRRLAFQRRLTQSILATEHLPPSTSRAAAAAGQSGLMTLYEQLFSQFDIMCGNILLTQYDVSTPEQIGNLKRTVDELLDTGIIPIINENDVTSVPLPGKPIFTDNDSLAARLSVEFNVDLLLLLTDVDGLYNKPPGKPGSYILDYYHPQLDKNIEFGEKSSKGRGGMESKMQAALYAAERNVNVVIANGVEQMVIQRVVQGESVGTVFTPKWKEQPPVMRQIAQKSREGQHKLKQLTSAERSNILNSIATAIEADYSKILETCVENTGTLTKARLSKMVQELRDLAKENDPVGCVTKKVKVSEGLEAVQEAVPLGVVYVIFDNQLDVLIPTVAAMIKTGNSMIFSAGQESSKATAAMLNAIKKGIETAGAPESIVMQIHTKDDVMKMLKLEDLVDLVVPRGGPEILNLVRSNTNIPVLASIDGITCVYVDDSGDVQKAVEIVADSKVSSTGSEMEVFFIHENMVQDGRALKIIRSLLEQNIALCGGPRAAKTLGLKAVKDGLNVFESNNTVNVEVVKDVSDAVKQISVVGTRMTDCIVAEDPTVVNTFMTTIDSACVMHNASAKVSNVEALRQGIDLGICSTRGLSRGPLTLRDLMTHRWTTKSQSVHTSAKVEKK